MGALKPAPPTPVDVVSAQEVDGVISETERQLATLEAERAEAETAAAWAERRARAEPLDPELHHWAAEQLNRFLEQLRTEHEAEMRALLSAAEARARECVARARSEADFFVSYARAIVDARHPGHGEQPSSTAPSARDREPTPEARDTAAATQPIPLAPSLVDAADEPPPVAPTGPVQVLTQPVAPTPPPVPAPAPTPTELTDRRPREQDPPTGVVATTPAVEPNPSAGARDAPEGAAPPDANDAPPAARDGAAEPAVVAPDASVRPPDPAPTTSPPSPADTGPPPPPGDDPGRPGPGGPEEKGFWPEEPESKFRRFTRRIHGLAILQVLAVVIILVVVLLRIG